MSLVVVGLHVHLLWALKKMYLSVSQLSGCRAGMVRPTLIKGSVTEILVDHFGFQEVWLCTPPYKIFKKKNILSLFIVSCVSRGYFCPDTFERSRTPKRAKHS